MAGRGVLFKDHKSEREDLENQVCILEVMDSCIFYTPERLFGVEPCCKRLGSRSGATSCANGYQHSERANGGGCTGARTAD